MKITDKFFEKIKQVFRKHRTLISEIAAFLFSGLMLYYIYSIAVTYGRA